MTGTGEMVRVGFEESGGRVEASCATGIPGRLCPGEGEGNVIEMEGRGSGGMRRSRKDRGALLLLRRLIRCPYS